MIYMVDKWYKYIQTHTLIDKDIHECLEMVNGHTEVGLGT